MLTRLGMGLMLAQAPRSARLVAQRIAVIGAIGEQDLAGAEAVQHIAGAPAVMGLAFGQLERDRIAVGIDEGVDLGRQSAARAPHASGCERRALRRLRRPPF